MSIYDHYNQQQQYPEANPQKSASPYAHLDETYRDFSEATFPSTSTKFQVTSVILTPSGTYNDQFRRPWTANVNVQNTSAVYEVVARAYHEHHVLKDSGAIPRDKNYMIDPSILAPVSGEFLQLAGRTESRAVNNQKVGWHQQTGRFMISINVQRDQAIKPTTYILIGYTDHLGFNETGWIDPQMEFSINTIFEVKEVQVNDGYGPRIVNQLQAVNQVLVDSTYSNVDEAKTIRMRPYEVAVSLARLNDPQLQGPSVTTVDTRDQQNGAPSFSNQSHTNSNNYMANVLSGLVNGHENSRQQNRNGAIEPYHAASKLLRDKLASTDPFIKAIAQVTTGAITSTFAWRDLLKIDPMAAHDDVCTVNWRDHADFANVKGENMHIAGTTNNWTDRTHQAKMAAQIAAVLPSLMADLAIRKVDIFASNFQHTPVLWVTHALSIIGAVDLTPQMDALHTAFDQQLLGPLTFNGGFGYSIDIQADMLGEIVVKIKIDHDPEAIYVQPSYSSSAMSPVITSSRDTLDNIAQAFNGLQSEVFRPTPHSPLIFDAMSGTQTGKRY